MADVNAAGDAGTAACDVIILAADAADNETHGDGDRDHSQGEALERFDRSQKVPLDWQAAGVREAQHLRKVSERGAMKERDG